MADIERLSLDSGDPDAERKQQLAELFPEAFEDGKIDIDALRDALGDIVDDGDERYAFTWPGKRDAIRQSQIPSTATLRPQKDKSVNWDDTKNIYIEGDNLEVLKLLQHSYHGKVKMIYIDPPYNTGGDFVYDDSFGDSIANYKRQAGLAGQSNPETSGRYHSKWCTMMYPRLKLARELLTDDGLMLISIDDNEVTNLRMMCDEVFGSQCFVNCIAVKMSEASGVKMAHVSHRLPKLKEYVLVYRKSHINLNSITVPKDKWDDEYRNIMLGLERNEFSFIESVINNAARTEDDVAKCKSLLSNASYETLTQYYSKHGITGYEDKLQFQFDNAYRIFQTVSMGAGVTTAINKEREKITTGVFFPYITSEGAMYIIKGDYSLESKKPRMQVLFAKDYLSVHPGDFWQDIKTTGLDNEGYVPFKNGKKPLKLMQRLISMQTFSDGDTILDFFSGSGTTAEACMRQNVDDGISRNFILVQLPESLDAQIEKATGIERKSIEESIQYLDQKQRPHTICELAEERITSAGDDLKAQGIRSDFGFRTFILDESGINKPDAGKLFDDVVKPGRSDEDIIFEMMLKWGLDLSLPIEKVDAADYPCYSVACGELVCCMADGLTMEALDAIAEMEPRRVLMLDSILTDTLKLNAIQIFRRVGERTGVEVELRTV